jgi:hypothetical protein
MPRPQTRLFKDYGQRAKSCNGRLKEIKTDKSCKKEPVGAVNHGKDYAENKVTKKLSVICSIRGEALLRV